MKKNELDKIIDLEKNDKNQNIEPVSEIDPQQNLENSTHYYRFHLPHKHRLSVFGNDWFALKAEGFARFFGTPFFLVMQTVIVFLWILANVIGYFTFDKYPFILLNLAFSLQAAYAAPLILLAQTRQADRDKAHANADAQHREAIARTSAAKQAELAVQTSQMVDLLKQNTQLTEATQLLSQRIEILTLELHKKILLDGK